MTEGSSKSYGSILKATAILGSASAVSIVFGVIRTKLFAVFLGPSGVGLIGIYNSITSMISVLAGMGVNRSGVRQIAEASGGRDRVLIALTIRSVRYTSAVLGALGAILLAA